MKFESNLGESMTDVYDRAAELLEQIRKESTPGISAQLLSRVLELEQRAQYAEDDSDTQDLVRRLVEEVVVKALQKGGNSAD